MKRVRGGAPNLRVRRPAAEFQGPVDFDELGVSGEYTRKPKFSNLENIANVMFTWVPETNFQNSEQVISALTSLRFKNGKQVVDDTINNWRDVNQVLMDYGWEFFVNYSESCFDEREFLFNQPALDLGRQKIQKEVDTILYERKGTVGIGKCDNCGCKELVQTTMQTRGADEAKTEFRQCVNCGFQWRVGG